MADKKTVPQELYDALLAEKEQLESERDSLLATLSGMEEDYERLQNEVTNLKNDQRNMLIRAVVEKGLTQINDIQNLNQMEQLGPAVKNAVQAVMEGLWDTRER